jgi:hypothetical protein
MAILEKYLVKGTKAFSHYLDLKKELELNNKKASEYQKIVDSHATREERKRVEDNLLS